VEERLDPGATAAGTITVTNENGGVQTYYIGTRNITSQDDNGKPIFSDIASGDPLEAASWIVPAQESVVLDVGESATVPYTIKVPDNASPGSYFAAIFVTREADVTSESGAGVGFQVASLFTIRVNGSVVEGLTVNEFSTDKAAYTDTTFTFTARMTNTGTVHQRPVGIIALTDMLGNEVTIEPALQLNERGGVVMPREDRLFETVYTHDGFLFGRYTATLSTLYGEAEKETRNNVTTFWVFPLKEIGVAAGLLTLVLLATMIGVRMYIRNALRRAGVKTHTEEAERIESFPKRLLRTLAWLTAIVALLFIGVVVFFA
jgi:hypothetical protein